MTDLSSGTTQIVSIAKGREDSDPGETAEWLEALDAVVSHVGKERAQYLFDRLSDHALSIGVESARARITPYANTISVERQPPYPGNLDIESLTVFLQARENFNHCSTSEAAASNWLQ